MKRHSIKIIAALKVGQSVSLNANDDQVLIDVWNFSELALRYSGIELDLDSNGIDLIVKRNR